MSFFNVFFANSVKTAEKVNIIFEEMKIPLNINQLSELENYDNDSSELKVWLKKNGLLKILEFSKFLRYPIFKEEGLNRQVLRLSLIHI